MINIYMKSKAVITAKEHGRRGSAGEIFIPRIRRVTEIYCKTAGKRERRGQTADES